MSGRRDAEIFTRVIAVTTGIVWSVAQETLGRWNELGRMLTHGRSKAGMGGVTLGGLQDDHGNEQFG